MEKIAGTGTARKLSVGPEAGTGPARRLSVGQEEEQMSIATKREERDGGLRKVAGKGRVGLIGGAWRNGGNCEES